MSAYLTISETRRQAAYRHMCRALLHARDKQWEACERYAYKAARAIVHARWLGGDVAWGLKPHDGVWSGR